MRSTRTRSHIGRIGATVLLLAVAATAWAQQHTGGITGVVRDATGGAVPGATVTAVHGGTGATREAVTNGQGGYLFTALPIGVYRVRVSLAGFREAEQAAVRVVSGETAPVDVALLVGEVTDRVEVQASVPLIDRTTATLGTTRTAEEIADLPIALLGTSARSAAGFARTAPGVNFDLHGPDGQSGQDFLTVSRSSISGVPAGTWSYQIDGVDAGMGEAESGSDFISPIPEAIEEFRLTANSEAESGFGGGVSLALTVKSGTNDLHGSLFHYHRNAALNARSFFADEVSPEEQNEGGFSLGGPVVLPGLYDGRNRTFFFSTLDIYRWRQSAAGQIATVPTAAMRAGDFRELLGEPIGVDALGRPIRRGQIYDPATTRPDGQGGFIRDPFPGNVIPAARLSGVSLAFQQGYAAPTGPGTQANWVGVSVPQRVDKDQVLLKFDHQVAAHHKVSVSYEGVVPWFVGDVSGRSGHSFIAGGAGFLAPEISDRWTDDRDSYRYRFSYLWTVSPQMLVSVRTGVTRNPNRVLSAFPIGGPAATFAREAGLTGTLNPQTPRLTIEGTGSFGPILDGIRVASQRTPASVDLTWSTGAHTVKTGVSFVGLPFSSRDASQTDGSFSFTDRVTGLPGVTNTGLGYASFLLGAVDGAGVTTQVDQRAFAGAWGLFVQDQWAIHPKLTVSYGLRWDLFLPMEEHQDKISSFDPALPNPAAGGRLGALSIYGQGPGRNGLQSVAERYYKAFAPRVGVTYAFTPQTVLRASYGISYLPYWQKFYGTQGPSQPTAGFSATRNVTTLDNGVTPAFTWDAGFPATFPELPLLDPTLQNGSTIMFIDRGDHRPPIVQNIGVEIGRELPFQMALRVGYVGTLAHRLPMSGMDLNALPLEQLGLGNLLLADIHSPDAREAGIPLPWEGFTGSVAQALRPFPHYLSIPVLGAQIGRTSYHALQLNLQKRFGAGLTFLAAYTWSKNLGNTNFRGFTSAGDNIGVQHPDFLEDEQTILSKDRTHMLNLSWTYALPFGRGARWLGEAEGWVQQLVGGWRVSGIQNYHSGAPITVGTRASNPGGIGAWATRMAGVPVVATRCGDYDPGGPGQDRYLNLEAFATPAPFTLGDTSTLPDVRQCGWLDETLLVEKTVALGRGVRFMVGTMATNVFNRHQWTSLNADINNPDQFGRFTGASSPRTIQFYSRLEF